VYYVWKDDAEEKMISISIHFFLIEVYMGDFSEKKLYFSVFSNVQDADECVQQNNMCSIVHCHLQEK
jgi:hypothetical protein